jgi:flagellar assembly protein FliH
VAERKISLSKVITKPRLSESRILIGFDQNKPEERMVPESAYCQLEVKSRLAGEEGYRRGFEEGKKTGHNEGLSLGKAESKAITDQIQPLLSDIARQKNEILLLAENDLLNLALTIAEKIVGSLATAHQELVIDTIKKSLPILLEKSRLTIKVAPEQEEFVRQNFENILSLDKDLKEIKIEADRRIGPGGCILETASGRVDARIEKQLEVLTSALEKQIPTPEN